MKDDQRKSTSHLGSLLVAVGISLAALATGFFGPLVWGLVKVGSDRAKALPPDTPSQPEKGVRSIPGKPVPRGTTRLASLAEGKRLYGVYCLVCHQEGGMGKVGFAPSIRNPDFLALASDQFLRTTIIGGRPGTAMTGWGHLRHFELDSILLYLRSGENPKATSLTTADPTRKISGDAKLGRPLYAAYCAACHGENATGYAEGGSGPGIGNPGFLGVASDDFIFQNVKHGRVGTPMRAFVGARGLANLSEEQVGHIIAYLRGREPSAPAVIASRPGASSGAMHFKANCAACHKEDGSGQPGTAPSIRNRDFLAIASDAFIKETVHKGRPGTAMVQRPDLSDKVLDEIIAFLRSVPTENAVKVEVDASKDLASMGDPHAGESKYTTFCATCHGPEGAGYVAGGSGPGIGLTGFLAAVPDDYIYQTLKLGRIGTAMRPFLGAEGLANLNDKDAHDIIAYLRRLEAAGN